MMNFWHPVQSMETSNKLVLTTDDCGTQPEAIYCEILNSREVLNGGFYGGKERDETFPVAQLKITCEDFAADYFTWASRDFVSERMRQAMALDLAAVRFFDVDASQSAPLPRSKNYQIMEVAAAEDVSDPANSLYEMGRLMPDMPLSPSFVRHIAFRPDAAPKYDMFHDRFFGNLFCTEALVLRVLRAGCEGVDFWDANNPIMGRYFYRTLRGVEEYIEWDPVNKIKVMAVVHHIN